MVSREQVLHLLAEAAELEHNLLCSYLFAAFSLKQSVDEDLQAHELKAVERWRAALMAVCVEEMAHLAQVANLMTALGARPHFNRPNLPVAPGYHPAGIAVSLTPFDSATLAHFVFLERSDQVPIEDPPRFAADLAPERPTTADTLTPSAPHYETIGEFYAVLKRQLTALCETRSVHEVFVGTQTQLDAQEAGIQSLRRVTDLASAHDAIEMIVEQGEGGSGTGDASHFARFDAMAGELRSLQAARPGFAPARRVGHNPVMRAPHDADRTYVVAPAARSLLDIANGAYWLMLRFLAQLFDTPQRDAALRSALYAAMLNCMHLLADAASELTRLPATEDASGPLAGVTFTMMRSTEGIAGGVPPAPLLLERVDELAEAINDAPLEDALRSRLDNRIRAMRETLQPA